MLRKAETVGETKGLRVEYRNSEILIHCRLRPGRKGHLLFLHGLGCSMDDFLRAYETASLSEYTLASFDFPGCGRSSYTETTSLDVDDLVEYSDSGTLLEKMLKLGLPTLFLYGSENRDLPSIRELKRGGVGVVGIESSNHFPQYDNPDAFYERISDFIHTLA